MSDSRERFPRVSAFSPAPQASGAKRPPRKLAALLSYGFRPFFLGAAVWAVVSLAPWIGAGGSHVVTTGYGAVAWHAHETLFGFAGAAMAGFILTAIPNWTGRRPLAGTRLAALFALWCAGRAAFLAPGISGLAGAAVADGVFLPVLAWLAARDVVAARNGKNVKTVALLGLFAGANIGFHYQLLSGGAPDGAFRLAIAALIGLVMLIGGRMAPGFTHQWLLARKGDGLPALFTRFDMAALAAAGTGLALWVMEPRGDAAAFLLVLTGLLHLVRMSRWRGWVTWREPLVLVLHVAYGFVALGFLLAGVAAFTPDTVPPAAALHAWTTGAVGTMTLGVMTRASRGHTGRSFTASPLTTGSYVAVVLATFLRIAAAVLPAAAPLLLAVAAAAWTAAFLSFVAEHAVLLVRGRAAP